MIGAADRLRARFRDQFTPTERGWVYRSRGVGPALPLGDEDHAALVAGFGRSMRRLMWLAVCVSILIWGVLDWQGLHPAYWVVAIPFSAVFCAAMWWAWRAPNRLLDGRAPVAPALSRGAAFRGNMRTMPWSALVAGIAVSVAMAASVWPWTRDDAAYLVGAALFLAFFAGMAIAKRRAG